MEVRVERTEAVQGEQRSRLSYLLGEVRRQMNGAVVGSMRLYGDEYGLNYGVSLPTLRELAKAEAKDHKFARQLYRQEIRELRLASFWVADGARVAEELEFWSGGIINSEVAEEGAFALFHCVEGIERWLDSDKPLLQYCAVMSIAKRFELSGGDPFAGERDRILQLINIEPHLIPKAVVALLDVWLNNGGATTEIERFLAELPSDAAASKFIRDEIAWRLEYR